VPADQPAAVAGAESVTLQLDWLATGSGTSVRPREPRFAGIVLMEGQSFKASSGVALCTTHTV
jgi:hypothetical protein